MSSWSLLNFPLLNFALVKCVRFFFFFLLLSVWVCVYIFFNLEKYSEWTFNQIVFWFLNCFLCLALSLCSFQILGGFAENLAEETRSTCYKEGNKNLWVALQIMRIRTRFLGVFFIISVVPLICGFTDPRDGKHCSFSSLNCFVERIWMLGSFLVS